MDHNNRGDTLTVNSARIGAFSSKFKSASHGATAANKTALGLAAEVAKVALEQAPGAPHTVKGKPVKVTAKVLEPTAYVAWPGVARLVNDPTKAHRIEQRDFVGPLTLPGIGFRMWANHPGTHGKHFFETGTPVAQKAAAEAYLRTHRLELAKHFIGG